MSTQHTPGPWKAVYVGSSDWDLDGPTTQEDWTLAAAAPDLLKALEELLEVQDEPCRIDHQGYCQSHYLDNVNSHNGCRVANARALVAKVKGGAA